MRDKVRPETSGIGVHGRKLRSNKHQGRVHPKVKRKTKTLPAWLKREDGDTCSHHTHDAGERWPKKKRSGKPITVLRADTGTISEAATQRGQSFTKVEPGDARAIRKPKTKGKGKRKTKRGAVINQSRTRRCSYFKHAERLRTRRDYGGFTS